MDNVLNFLNTTKADRKRLR